eukprot:2859260-Prymnesium_polylepis.2
MWSTKWTARMHDRSPRSSSFVWHTVGTRVLRTVGYTRHADIAVRFTERLKPVPRPIMADGLRAIRINQQGSISRRPYDQSDLASCLYSCTPLALYS